MYKKPPLTLQTSTLWDYPSQHYGTTMQGNKAYKGATPSYVVWNLLQRYTKAGDVVVDPMCGSGTTLAVCTDLGRQGLGYDLQPQLPEIVRADARHLPLAASSIDFYFVDPPYSTHLKYSGQPECIGELDADGGGYYEAMEAVFKEADRILKPGAHLGLYVSDSWRPDHPFCAIGFELFQRLSRHFTPVDIVTVVRRNKLLNTGHAHKAAAQDNSFVRGFNYLFIMRKPGTATNAPAARSTPPRVPPLSPPPPRVPRGKQLKKKKKHRI